MIADKETNLVIIEKNDFVSVTKMNHVIEVQYLEKRNNMQTVLKLNKDEYLVLSTGEIKEVNKSHCRSDNKSSLYKTFRKLRYLINNNFTGKDNELFITLTYKENMTDTNRLYDDFRKFIQRFKYKFSYLGKFDYLDIVEPQGRGAWHHHLLIKFLDLQSVFIEHDKLSSVWGLGFIKIKKIKNIDNVGAYLTAYMADIPLEDYPSDSVFSDFDIIEKKVDNIDKKFIKGGRLSFYPSGMNLYRKSKGISFPEKKVCKYGKFKEEYEGLNSVYESSVFLDIDGYQNTIKYEHYNLKRR